MSRLTEEELQQLKNEILEDLAPDYFVMRRPGFNIESKCITQDHGIAEFIVSTDQNQGIQFYEKGNAKMLANKSIEIVAGKQNKDNASFAITLDAKSGNILISCPGGDLVLEGANVKIRATDADGDVFINSQKTLGINAPEVEVKGTKTNISATSDLHIDAASMDLYSQTGDVRFASGQDPILGPSIFGQIFPQVAQSLKRLGINV
tara:strand:- start:329 stop:946 length:618 start_codon:yes stop_codon:yes gene_type:complete